MITIQQIQHVFRNSNHLLKNFLALGIVQATNFIVPLISFPYLVRVLTSEKFGVISYGLTFLTYATTFTDYGFNLSATRSVALHRESKTELSRIFSSVMITKLFLMGISFVTIVVLCLVYPRFKSEAFAYLLSVFFILGSVLMPVWFFQGIEKMKHITTLNMIAKVLQLILIVIIVKQPGDYIWILALYGIANVLSGLYGIYIAISRYQIKITKISYIDIRNQIISGWPVFLSNLSTIIIGNGAIIVLGFFVSTEKIGDYSIAEKILFAIWSILSLFSQAIYPYACRMAKQSHAHLRRFIWYTCIPFTIFITLLCGILFAFSSEIIFLISGKSNLVSISVLRILSIVPLIVCLNIPAYQTLLAYDMKRSYATVFYIISIVNLAFTFIMVRWNGLMGAAQSMVVVQLVLTISLHLTLEFNKEKKSLWR